MFILLVSLKKNHNPKKQFFPRKFESTYWKGSLGTGRNWPEAINPKDSIIKLLDCIFKKSSGPPGKKIKEEH